MDSATPGFDDDPPPEPRDGWLLVRIHVPELNVYKCLQFPSDRMVWDVKQQVLASLPKELKESFNYGLFCPPSNGKAGKFLDEERRLGDYPFNGPVGYLELKYKRRVYKMLNLDERQLKALHTRANLRRFLECINGGHVEKIAKMCAKGLDPNFHCPDSGETPLTVATGAKKPNKLLIALVNGGALLDYRTKDGATALHKAVEKDSLEAVTTLLELGASPNYKDGRGITPLYISITRKCDPKITESLLHDHAALGIQDNQGWQEVHQACRHGLVHHLEHLLFYGADMDGRNASGNTPLHVCAVNNQEACARMLLFRGAQRGALNYANQTPYQVAVIAGNLELAEMIQNYKSDDVVPFRGPPRYNPKRRSGIGWLNANGGVCVGVGCGTLTRNGSACGGHHGHGPPSPCPSEHMPYSSASSSLSEGSSGHRSHEDDISIVTDKSLGDTSDIISDSSGVGTNSDSAACSIGHPSTTVVCMEPYAGTAVGHIRLQPGDVIEVVGSTDCGLLEGYVRGSNQAGFFPADCVQEVNLRQKNITNVSTAGPNHSQSSPFLQQQQQHQNSSAASGSSGLQGSPQLSLGGGSSGGGSGVGIGIGGTLPRQAMSQHQHHQQHQQQQQQQQHHQQSPSLSMNSNGSSQALNGGGGGGGSGANGSGSGGGGNGGGPQQYSSATAPRMKKTSFNEPRNVILHRAKRGFGFILRGAKASSPLMQLKPSDRFPALQYLDDVDPGGVADMAGLRPGDFLLSIGGEDVRAASHEKVVEMIRSAGALVSMTVISPQFPPHNQMNQAANASSIGHQFLPGLGGGGHLSSGPSTPQTSHRQCATLPRKMSLGPGGGGGGGGNGGNGGNIGRMPAPMPPRRDPKTTLSVGRARAKSMVAGLENGGERDHDEHPGPPHHHQPHHQQLHLHHQQQQQLHHQHGDGHSTHTTKSSSVESIATATPTPTPTSTHPGTPVQLRTASIKARPTSSRITAAELEELFQRQQGEAGTGGDGDGEGEGSNRYSTMMTTSRFQSGTDSGAATPPATGHGSPLKGPLVYSSVSEMKRKTMSKAKNGGGSATGTLRGKPCAIPTVGGRDLKRFHSTPDLMAHAAGSASSTSGSASSIWTASGAVGRKGHHSQDDVATLHASMQRLNLPPPSHPPPPPPVGQVVKVETRPGTGTSTSTPGSEYESTLTLQQKLKKRAEAEGVASATIDGVQSSFNPAASAKIYASPQELRNVMAWKLRQSQVQESRQPQSGQNGQQQQSNSQQQLPASSAAAPPPPPPMQQQQQQQPQPNSQYAQPTTMRARSQSLSLTKSPPASQSHYAPSQQQQQHQSQQQNGNNNNQNSTTASGGNNHNNNISSVNNISLNNISLVSSMSSNSSNNNNTLPAGPAPPIPEPDYSLSESDGEDENSILVARNTKLNEKIALIDVPETSGNSQTSAGSNSSASGSASGSGSISHSLSVDEIQRIRSNLKTSKSYPNGLLKQGGGEASSANGERAADNSSNNNNGHGKEVAAAAANNNELPNDEEADNSSSGVSSDQDVVAATAAAATAPRPTDTIKKKPSVTIVEEPKTIPDKKEATEGGVPSAAPATTATTPSTAAGSAAPASATTTTTTTTSTSTTAKGGHGVLVTIGSASPATAVATTTTSASTSVASTAAAFEAKATATATTVTVKQMVQQQHAPVIQQQQQQLHQQTQQTQVALAASKVKTLVVQSQQLGPKAQPAMAGRIAGASTTATPPQAQHLHPNQKLLAAQAQILLQQQQQQHHLHQQQQQQQQQLAHQQHLQQILKAKAALGPSATAAIVASRQQELANSDPTTESEHEQRSDDDGELSPSPPAKAFQRHNSLTRKQAAAIAMQRATRSTAAVSLVQLPPPIEADSGDEMSMPMPMSGSASSSVLSAPVVGRAAMAMAMEMCPENIVLAPPPQFCDCNDIKQQQHQHHHHPPQHHHQQQQQLHHHQQQQQHLQLQQQQHQQQALAMSMHAHMMHGGGSNGRVRIVGTVPKTTHHRLH